MSSLLRKLLPDESVFERAITDKVLEGYIKMTVQDVYDFDFFGGSNLNLKDLKEMVREVCKEFFCSFVSTYHTMSGLCGLSGDICVTPFNQTLEHFATHTLSKLEHPSDEDWEENSLDGTEEEEDASEFETCKTCGSHLNYFDNYCPPPFCGDLDCPSDGDCDGSMKRKKCSDCEDYRTRKVDDSVSGDEREDECVLTYFSEVTAMDHLALYNPSNEGLHLTKVLLKSMWPMWKLTSLREHNTDPSFPEQDASHERIYPANTDVDAEIVSKTREFALENFSVAVKNVLDIFVVSELFQTLCSDDSSEFTFGALIEGIAAPSSTNSSFSHEDDSSLNNSQPERSTQPPTDSTGSNVAMEYASPPAHIRTAGTSMNRETQFEVENARLKKENYQLRLQFAQMNEAQSKAGGRKGKRKKDPEIECLGSFGERQTRSCVRKPVVVKIEKPLQGDVRCPHKDCARKNYGLHVSTRGCNIVTCKNHKPSWFYFCYHCKAECPGGEVAPCQCPKRNGVEERIQAQQDRTEYSKKNPTCLLDD